MKLAAGKSIKVSLKSLSYGVKPPGDPVAQSLSWGETRVFWTKPGEYALTVGFQLSVKPSLPGTTDGKVTVTSNAVKLKVVDPEKAKAQGKTDPPGVALEAKDKNPLADLNKIGHTAENKTLRITIKEATARGKGTTGGARSSPEAFDLQVVAEIENLTDQKLTLAAPTIRADSPQGVFWLIGTEGMTAQWDGNFGPREKRTVSFIRRDSFEIREGDRSKLPATDAAKRPRGPDGPVPESSLPQLTLAWRHENLSLRVRQAIAVVPDPTRTKCTCGCTRSEAMLAELRKQRGPTALAAIEKSLAEIAERENRGEGAEKMIAHRLRLLKLAAEIREMMEPGRALPVAGM